MNNPKISIICPSYNHEKYVGYFIESVLSQTVQDFELIIVDDCSTDNNVREIEKFNDSRIKLIKHEYNQGVNAGLNDGIRLSSGKYIVVCASDDVFEAYAFEKYLEVYNNHDYDAIFINCSVIDEYGDFRNDYDDNSLPFIANDTREKFLHTAFLFHNPLYSPGFSCKRELFEQLYPFSLSASMTQDYQINIDILIKTDRIIVLPEKLVKYRICRTEKTNLSNPSRATTLICKLEDSYVLDKFLQIEDLEWLSKIFAEEIKKLGIEPYSNTIDFFLGQVAMLSPHSSRKIWGYHKIYESYDVKNAILFEKYNFTYKNLLDSVHGIPDDSYHNKSSVLFDWIREKIKCVKKRWL